MPDQENVSKVQQMKETLKSLASSAGKTLKEHPEILTVPAGMAAGGYLTDKALGNPLTTAGGAAAGGGLAYALTDILKRETPGVLSQDLKPEDRDGPLDTFAASPVTTTAKGLASALPSAALWSAQAAGLAAVPGYSLYRLRDALKRANILNASTTPPAKAKGLLGLAGGFLSGAPGVWDPIQETLVNKPVAKIPDSNKILKVLKAALTVK